MNALSSAQSLRELKHNYRRLAQIHHPDKGGNLLGMQEINAEYERMRLRLKSAANTPLFHSEDFSEVYVGMELFVNGTPVEVLEVLAHSFRIVAKGRSRQAVFDIKTGVGVHNQKLYASRRKNGYSHYH